jgi:uncharacterized small protein (DUF1192 family)
MTIAVGIALGFAVGMVPLVLLALYAVRHLDDRVSSLYLEIWCLERELERLREDVANGSSFHPGVP